MVQHWGRARNTSEYAAPKGIGAEYEKNTSCGAVPLHIACGSVVFCGGVVAGPFGLIISYSIAAGVVEGKLIPELKNKLKSVQSFFTTLSNTVKQANKDIDAAKLKLTTEIAAIGEIKTETETTRFYVDYDDLMLSLLKEAAKKMINTCNEYQKRHGKKTLFEVPEV